MSHTQFILARVHRVRGGTLGVRIFGSANQPESGSSMVRYTQQGSMMMKFLLLGESGVGKSAILRRFADGTFDEQNFITTIGL